MNRLVIFGVAATTSSALFAGPYTEGWLKPRYTSADTNVVVYADQGEGYSAAVFTNSAVARPALMRTMVTAATATPKLAAAALSSLDGSLTKTLPESSTGRIRELARGLEYNWEKCFDFVRNYIAFAVYPGIMRGPDRTLMDREGNDADQAYLLVALLRASGYDSATVMYEPLVAGDSVTSGFRIPALKTGSTAIYNASDWIGFKMSYTGVVSGSHAYMVATRFRMAGVPCVQYGSTDIVIPHYWVAVTVDGVTKYLDPSLKPSKVTTARDALTDMGYDRDALIAAAGGTTISGMGVKNLSASGIASHLTTLCTNLRNVWTNANEAAEYFVGSKKIVERTDDAFFHGTYFSGAPIDLFKQTSDYVNALRTKTVLTCNDSDFFSFYLDEVGLRNLWLTSSGSSTVLHLDDATIKTVSTSSGYSTIKFLVDVQHVRPTTHPYYLTRGDDRVYSLVVGFGGDAKNGMRKYASEELSRVKATGLADSTPRMIAASLYVQGQQWLSQCVMSLRLMNKVNNDNHQYYYNIGIAGQNGGPYVDMANCFMHSGNNTSQFGADGFFSSALEHSVVEQLNDIKAVSTVKILNLANQNGNAVYFVTSQNVDSVVNQISNYGSSFKSSMTEAAKAGAIYLLPANGSTTLNQWTGTGYVKHHATDDGTVETTMAISGGMNGGYSSEEGLIGPDGVINSTTTVTTQDAVDPDNPCGDPIAMPSGAYGEHTVDITLNRKTPLIWRREYDTRSAHVNIGLGYGWSHNYDSSIITTTDAESVFGWALSSHAVASVVAMTVADDLLLDQNNATDEENARKWMIAALITQWWTEQLGNTSVSVKAGSKANNFLKLYDGSYLADPGDTSTLSVSNGLYVLKERHGDTYLFDWKNMLSEIIDQSGNHTRMCYTYDQFTNAFLVSVENDFDARLDIAWDGGLIKSVSDGAGRVVSYNYDAAENLSSVIDVRGKIWNSVYDSTKHLLVSKNDPEGNILIRNTYNEFSQVTNQISNIGGKWVFGYIHSISAWNMDPYGNIKWEWYDDNLRPTLKINQDKSASRIGYDGHGHVIVKIDEAGHVTQYGFNERDSLISVTTGSKDVVKRISFEYDTNDRMVASIDAMGRITRLLYDDCNRVIKRIEPDSSYIETEWHANGTKAKERRYNALGLCVMSIDFVYNDYGLPTSTTLYGKGLPLDGVNEQKIYNHIGLIVSSRNANGEETHCEYDAAGRITSLTDPCSYVTKYQYSENGNLIRQIDAKNRITETSYSPSAEIVSIKFANGSSVSNIYDLVDRVVEKIDLNGEHTLFTYDCRGRIAKVEDSIGSETRCYDLVGNLIALTNAAGEVMEYEYDELSRLALSRNKMGSEWKNVYDSCDRIIATCDPLGRQKNKAYDIHGRLVSELWPSGRIDKFGYDDFGYMSAYTNAEGSVFCRYYDALGRLIAVTNAIGIGICKYGYDSVGNLIRTIDGEGNAVIRTYDKLNRVTSITGIGINRFFQYDAVGNLCVVTTDDCEEHMTYDSLDQVTNAVITIHGSPHIIGWSRNAAGLITGISYGQDKIITRAYDQHGRLSVITDWAGHSWNFYYDALNRLIRLRYPNGKEKNCTYDGVGRLISWCVSEVQGRTISYDAVGRRISDRIDYGPVPMVESCNSKNTFNTANQLIACTRDSNVHTSVTDTFTYDRNGAMISKNNKKAFSYNAMGEIVEFSSSGITTACLYDGLCNRIKVGNMYLIPNLTDEYRRPLYAVSENTKEYYIWGDNELLGIIDEAGELLITYSDDYSSVIGTSSVEGSLLSSIVYGPHGEIWGLIGDVRSDYAWLGGYGVRRTSDDMYLTQHRIYDTINERFTSSDPLGLDGGLNLYAYANGNPIAYIDPRGLSCQGKTYGFESPDNHLYRAGDKVRFPDGREIEVSKDMTPHEFHKYLEDKAWNGEIDPYYYGAYENSNAWINQRLIGANYAKTTGAVGLNFYLPPWQKVEANQYQLIDEKKTGQKLDVSDGPTNNIDIDKYRNSNNTDTQTYQTNHTGYKIDWGEIALSVRKFLQDYIMFRH